jgi:hypothetical protein
MAEPRFEERNEGFYELRRSPQLQALLLSVAQNVAAGANDALGDVDGYPANTEHFRVSSQQGRKNPQGRWRATVITATGAAARYEAQNQLLLRLLGGAK